MNTSEMLPVMEAKARRDAVRAAIVDELKKTPGLSADLLGLLAADVAASVDFHAAVRSSTTEE